MICRNDSASRLAIDILQDTSILDCLIKTSTKKSRLTYKGLTFDFRSLTFDFLHRGVAKNANKCAFFYLITS